MLIHLPIDPRLRVLSYLTKICSCSAREATNASRYYNICIKINKWRDISVDILWLRVKYVKCIWKQLPVAVCLYIS